MNRSIVRVIAFFSLLGSGIACTANVENPSVDQTGREGDTSCATQCNDTQTTCAAKCNDDTCKASCKTTYDDCATKCTTTTTTTTTGSGGKTN